MLEANKHFLKHRSGELSSESESSDDYSIVQYFFRPLSCFCFHQSMPDAASAGRYLPSLSLSLSLYIYISLSLSRSPRVRGSLLPFVPSSVLRGRSGGMGGRTKGQDEVNERTEERERERYIYIYNHILSSRDPLHFKFQKVKKCNGDVNVTKLNSKTEFPVTFTSFFYYLVKAGDSSCPFTLSCPGARLFVLGATFCNKLERDL